MSERLLGRDDQESSARRLMKSETWPGTEIWVNGASKRPERFVLEYEACEAGALSPEEPAPPQIHIEGTEGMAVAIAVGFFLALLGVASLAFILYALSRVIGVGV